mgnify:CR=1 FL=1
MKIVIEGKDNFDVDYGGIRVEVRTKLTEGEMSIPTTHATLSSQKYASDQSVKMMLDFIKIAYTHKGIAAAQQTSLPFEIR